MTEACPASTTTTPAAPHIHYTHAAADELLCQRGTLAVLDFGMEPAATDADPRHLRVALPGIDGATLPREHWRVAGKVHHGGTDGVNWVRGGGWLFASLVIAEADHDGDIARAAESAYRTLTTFLDTQPEGRHVQRLWNYLDRINEGAGDAERYKQFCDGRRRGMGGFFDGGFPAATAIGLPQTTGALTLYCLACEHAGQRTENPRQVSAWRYPRRYGRTAPSFARAMLLPARDALAISGTAAITGHESRHTDDLAAQLDEIRANIEALLTGSGLPEALDEHAWLKVYLRHTEDAETVADFFRRQLPQVHYLLLQGDICRRELLVEIDGWRYA